MKDGFLIDQLILSMKKTKSKYIITTIIMNEYYSMKHYHPKLEINMKLCFYNFITTCVANY